MPEHSDTQPAVTPAAQRMCRHADGRLTVAAPAKINLNLLVGPAGEDGYHPLDSLVARISLHDTLELRLRDDGEITLACDGFDCGASADNLVMRAAKLLADGRGGGVDITLSKAIPAGAGLGGGSSDAAAALLGLAELWQLELADAQLHELACQLGSDVPMFLAGPASRMTGRGELLEAITVHPFHLAMFLPSFGCPTPAVYGAYDSSPSAIGEQLDVAALAARPPSAWRDGLANDLSSPAMTVAPQLADLSAKLNACCPSPVYVTGSGSAMFSLCDTAAEAAAMRAGLPAELQAICTLAASNPW